MKTRLLFITAVSALLMTSCRFEHKVIEESFPDGSPRKVCVYLGKGEGRELLRETVYWENKQPRIEGSYKNGKRDGHWTSWYENGKKWSEGDYVMGKREGKSITYFENGKMRYEGWFKADMQSGKWRYYDETGKLLQEVDYSAMK